MTTTPHRLSKAHVSEVWTHCCQSVGLNGPDFLAQMFYEELKRMEEAVFPGLTPIAKLPLKTPTLNVLRRNGVHSVEQLRAMTWGQLLSLRGVGLTKAQMIRDALSSTQLIHATA